MLLSHAVSLIYTHPGVRRERNHPHVNHPVRGQKGAFQVFLEMKGCYAERMVSRHHAGTRFFWLGGAWPLSAVRNTCHISGFVRQLSAVRNTCYVMGTECIHQVDY